MKVSNNVCCSLIIPAVLFKHFIRFYGKTVLDFFLMSLLGNLIWAGNQPLRPHKETDKNASLSQCN